MRGPPHFSAEPQPNRKPLVLSNTSFCVRHVAKDVTALPGPLERPSLSQEGAAAGRLNCQGFTCSGKTLRQVCM